MRILDFFDGFTSASPPTQGIVTGTALIVFSNDAAYVSAKGAAAANGDAYYNSTDNALRIYRNGAWEYVPNQPAVTGTRASPQNVTAAGGVLFSGNLVENIWFVQGNGGAITLTANPAITAGAFIGQKLRIIGRSDTNTLTIPNGLGTSLNGDVLLDADASIDLDWDGTNWRESCRR